MWSPLLEMRILQFLYSLLLHLCTIYGVHMRHGTCAEVREQFCGVSSFLLSSCGTSRQTILPSCQPGNLTAFHNYISLIYVTPKEILWFWCQHIWEHRECVCGLSRRDWQDDLSWDRILRGQCCRICLIC